MPIGTNIKVKSAIFNWSGGKDSALTLYHTLQAGTYAIKYLLTTVNEKFQRISMHGVRLTLLKAQAQSIGLPLYTIMIPEMVSMQEYDQLMHQNLIQLHKEGITHSFFGDIFLEDLKKYREERLAQVNLKGVFPIWKRPTPDLVKEFLRLGFKAITVCVNEKYLDKSFVGRVIDEKFFQNLPNNADPCGENGEYHSFVYDGPIFKQPIKFKLGEVVHKALQPNPTCNPPEGSEPRPPYDTGFWFCDLLPL